MAAQAPEITTEFATKGSVSEADRSDRSDRSSDDCPADDYPDFPASLLRCVHCGKGGAVNMVALPTGAVRQLHRECEAPWFATHDNPRSKQE
jgi:hypothetical protein